MFKTIFVASVLCFATGECAGFSTYFNRKTTTEQPEELTTTTATSSDTNDRVPATYFKVNNIPLVEEDCTINYVCKKKLKHAENPRPCVKFCMTTVECLNGKKLFGAPGQCVELNEELVTQEYNDCKRDGSANSNKHFIMPVALIDFPCQPGYLPDSRGRCREVW